MSATPGRHASLASARARSFTARPPESFGQSSGVFANSLFLDYDCRQRARAAAVAISRLRFGLRAAARAGPRLSPPSPAAACGLGSRARTRRVSTSTRSVGAWQRLQGGPMTSGRRSIPHHDRQGIAGPLSGDGLGQGRRLAWPFKWRRRPGTTRTDPARRSTASPTTTGESLPVDRASQRGSMRPVTMPCASSPCS